MNFNDDLSVDNKYDSSNDFEIENFEIGDKKEKNINDLVAVESEISKKQSELGNSKKDEIRPDLKSRIENLISDINNFQKKIKENEEKVNIVNTEPIQNILEKKSPYGIDKSELEKRLNEFKKADNVQQEERYRKLFIEKDAEDEAKQEDGEPFNWYLNIARWPTIFIVLFDLLILIRGYFATNNSLLAIQFSWMDLAQLPFEVAVFIFLSHFVIKKKNQLPRIAGIACALVGFQAGVINAVIKLFWNREMWNIFYLSSEPVFLGIIGFIVGLLSAALFYEEKIYKA